MIEEWLTEFRNSENQLIIEELAKRYRLSKGEYINLINGMIYYYAISEKPNTLEAVTTICNKIMEFRQDIEKHQNHLFFQECITIFLEKELENGSFNKIDCFLREGFIFHSFNGAFLPTIQERGLILKEKPWDLQEVEQIRKIFEKRNNKNIFGMYQGRKETPIFFANNLLSSAYYGLSSPTFFRKFVENDKNAFNAFFNRDYETSKKSIEDLCSELDSNEKDTVFCFFQKYWEFFSSTEFPCIAVSTKKKMNIDTNLPEKLPYETELEYYRRIILETKNTMIQKDIRREDIEIFDYKTFSFSTYTNEKAY